MTRANTIPVDNRHRRPRPSPATPAPARAADGSAPSRDPLLDEVESVARIGWYSLDVASGRWSSSKGLDLIFGIDAALERTVDTWAALVHPADRAAMLAYFTDDVLRQGRPFDRQYRIVRADNGEERWVHGRGALELDEAGRPARLIGTIADITDQHLLQARNRRLAQALVQTQEAVLITGSSGDFEFANPAFERLSGVAPSELSPEGLGRLTRELPAETLADLTRTLSSGDAWTGELAHRTGDGSTRVSEASISPIVDTDGTVIGSVTVARDVTGRAEQARERERLVAAVEQAPTGIVITDRELRIVYANVAYATTVGALPSELVGRMAPDVAGIGLDQATLADMTRSVVAGQRWSAEVDHRNPDATLRRMEVNITPTHDANGDVTSWVGVMRDITEQVESRAALEASEGRLRTAFDTMLEGVTVLSAIRDDGGRIVDFRFEYSNPAIAEMSRIPVADQVGRTLLGQFPAHRTNGLFGAYVQVVETGVPFESGAIHYVDPDAAGGPLDQIAEHRAAKLGDGYVLSVRDITARHRAEFEMLRLATAIEQSADAVVITDIAGTIEYVNPAFSTASGYSREEAIGQNPRILQSGVHGPAFYAAMWATLTSGSSFVGDLTNRRKDGSLFQEEAVISPVRDRDDAITSYVAVKRNVTRERASEAALEHLARERTLIAGTLAELRAGRTPATTAESICRQVVSLTGVASASLLYFTLGGPAMPLAFVRADGGPAPLRQLPARRSQTLHERADEGPWVESWVHRPWHPYDRLFGELGVGAIAVAPIRASGRLIGLLEISSTDASATLALTELLPALLEFAGFAGALVGPAIEDLIEVAGTHERFAEIIGTSAFRPVFQPIVSLMSGAHVGYEALTRFTSGTAPNLVFADARAAGLGAELELATLAAAIEAAAGLPPDAWLSLNVSPDLVHHSRALPLLLAGQPRDIVLEITEHAEIDDYAAVRAMVATFGPRVSLAVDDAGAGFASLRHVVELQPRFLKVDISLVRHVDRDPTRQAMIAGLNHFAARSGCVVIAEGIEDEAEREMLGELGLTLGQGYLFGRPEPVRAS